MVVRRVVGVIALVALGAALALGLRAILGDDDPQEDEAGGAGPAVGAAIERPDEQANPEAAELYDVVTSFQDVTLHARYQVEVTGRPEASSILEVWQKDGRFRQEASIPAGGSTGRLLLLYLEDRVVLCEQPPDGRYSCTLVSETEQTTFEALRTGLLADLGDQPVTVRDDTIDDLDVRCFTMAGAGENELCATGEGVLVRVASPEGRFELIEFDTEVDDAVFTPPAPPGAGSG